MYNIYKRLSLQYSLMQQYTATRLGAMLRCKMLPRASMALQDAKASDHRGEGDAQASLPDQHTVDDTQPGHLLVNHRQSLRLSSTQIRLCRYWVKVDGADQVAAVHISARDALFHSNQEVATPRVCPYFRGHWYYRPLVCLLDHFGGGLPRHSCLKHMKSCPVTLWARMALMYNSSTLAGQSIDLGFCSPSKRRDQTQSSN